ncbi:MAG: hypothetical protein AUK48_04475 [Oscillatoriales cyanobacterium CG2_30_44_21]|nr:MAG: hypothetical protein AUK48_04475 [Oscillatoriales cyanobacterium CG2_30_44_21]
MPRLVGKKDNLALYTVLAVLVVGAGAVALEYFGVIDLVSDFGKETEVRSNTTSQPVKTSKPTN